MTSHAAPLSPQFRADLDRMEAEDLGPVDVPGALHVGEPAAVAQPPEAGSQPGPHHLLPPGTSPQAALTETLRRVERDERTVRAWATSTRRTPPARRAPPPWRWSPAPGVARSTACPSA